MQRDKKLLYIGIWILVIPYVGIPLSWKSFLLVATGMLMVVGYFFSSRNKTSRRAKTAGDTFTESIPSRVRTIKPNQSFEDQDASEQS